MNDLTPVSLMANALEQLVDFLRSGRAMPAHRAAVLLERIARDPEADIRLREQGGQLADLLCSRLAVFPKSCALNPAWLFGEIGRK